MTNKNTRSKGEYALDHILWGLISWLWFTKSLFRNIEGCRMTAPGSFCWARSQLPSCSGSQ